MENRSLELQKTQVGMRHLPNWKQDLPVGEQQRAILKAKYQSKPFGRMAEEEALNWTAALMLKINFITGWAIPEGSMNNVAEDQFQKHLIENYPTVNPNEVEFAFRKAGTTIEDWGKGMNLNLIDKILKPYLAERMEVSHIEEQYAIRQLPPPVYNFDWREIAEVAYQDFLKGVFDFMLLPVEVYQTVVDANFIAPELFDDFTERAVQVTKTPVVPQKIEGGLRVDFLYAENEVVVNIAKKMAVKFLFTTAKARGLKNLFVKS